MSEQVIEREEHYLDYLFYWLEEMWKRLQERSPGVSDRLLPTAALELCRKHFSDRVNMPDEDEPGLMEELETIRDAFAHLPDEIKRESFNGWPWRATPPTPLKADRHNDDQPADVVVLSGDREGKTYAVRRSVKAPDYEDVRVIIPAGMSRREALGQLRDILATAEKDWTGWVTDAQYYEWEGEPADKTISD